eukprot:m.194810 g.194810  ORF g.194810 m.194810 type:complete len:427 (-) comp25022_c0_seq1:112-1392(-)
MGAKGSKAQGRKKTNPYKKGDATTDDGGGAALHSAGSLSPHPGSHTLSGGGPLGGGALSGQPWESKGEPGLRTSTVPQLCPVTMDDSLAVWGIVDFSDRSTCHTPPRVTLSRATEAIDTFVSHVWHDVDFLSAMRLMNDDRATRSCHGSHPSPSLFTAEDVFYSLKAPGVMKGVRQLAARGLEGMSRDTAEWRVWMDLVCIDQYDSGHKAHVTRLLDDFVDQSSTMVVLLSTSYFTRLWCVYECCCFLAKHPVSHMAVYSWAFADRVTLSLERRAGAPDALQNLSGSTVASLREFTVAGAKCSFECDREVLVGSVNELYVSIEAFERFAKFTGILMVVWGLVMSPAVYNSERYRLFATPWIELASELHFEELHAALTGFDAVDAYKSHATSSNPEVCPKYIEFSQTYFDKCIGPLAEAERVRAVKS